MKKKKLRRKKVVNKPPVSLLPRRISQLIDKNSQSYLAVILRLELLKCEQLSDQEQAQLSRWIPMIGDCMRYAWHECVVRKSPINPDLVKLPGQLSEIEEQLCREALEAASAIAKRQLELGTGSKESTPILPATNR